MSAQLLASSKGCSRVGTNAVYDAFAGLDGSLRNQRNLKSHRVRIDESSAVLARDARNVEEGVT